jgi:hypothetical protein
MNILHFNSYLKRLKKSEELMKLFLIFYFNELKMENQETAKIRNLYLRIRKYFNIFENSQLEYSNFLIFSIYSSVVNVVNLLSSFSPLEEEKKIISSLVVGSTLSSIPIQQFILKNGKIQHISFALSSLSLISFILVYFLQYHWIEKVLSKKKWYFSFIEKNLRNLKLTNSVQLSTFISFFIFKQFHQKEKNDHYFKTTIQHLDELLNSNKSKL